METEVVTFSLSITGPCDLHIANFFLVPLGSLLLLALAGVGILSVNSDRSEIVGQEDSPLRFLLPDRITINHELKSILFCSICLKLNACLAQWHNIIFRISICSRSLLIVHELICIENLTYDMYK
jgi:hypothetical protein